jgi:hypothetical protein
MMFTQREHVDVSHNHHFVVVLLENSLVDEFCAQGCWRRAQRNALSSFV